MPYKIAIQRIRSLPTTGRAVAAVAELKKLDQENQAQFFAEIIEILDPQQRNILLLALINYKLLDPQWLLIRFKAKFSFNNGRFEATQSTPLLIMLEQRQTVLLDALFKKFSAAELSDVHKVAIRYLAFDFAHNTDTAEDVHVVAQLMLRFTPYLSSYDISTTAGQFCLKKALRNHCEELIETLFASNLNQETIDSCIHECIQQANARGLRFLLGKGLISVNHKVRGLTLLDLVLCEINQSPTPTNQTDPMLAVLFEFGVNVNAKNDFDNCALMQIHPHRSDVLQNLIDQGFEIHAEHIERRFLTLIIFNFAEFKAAAAQSMPQLTDLLAAQSNEYLAVYSAKIEQILASLRIRSPSPML